jgi:hypothetical protein
MEMNDDLYEVCYSIMWDGEWLSTRQVFWNKDGTGNEKMPMKDMRTAGKQDR